MTELKQEATFFNYIAPKIRALVLSFEGKASISVQKTSDDYATEVDIAVENLIVTQIQERFPGDAVMAEESFSDTQIPAGRIWIIDPICGTANIGRGLTSFCTNIALADKGVLIASCVVDHSQNDYFWSLGENKIYVNQELLEHKEKVDGMGILIDVDMGASKNLTSSSEAHYGSYLKTLVNDTDYMLMSLNTSLGFAYTAIGKIDGFVNVFNHPWDICAASFLLQQADCTITDLKGNPWTITSVGAIGARSPIVHKQLLSAYIGKS